MDTNSLIVYIKTEGIYWDVAKGVETRFDGSSYELYRPLLRGKKEEVIGLIKDELGGRIIKEFSALRAKTYSYLRDNNNKD